MCTSTIQYQTFHKKSFRHLCNLSDKLATSLLGGSLLISSNSFSHCTKACTLSQGKKCRQAILVNEFLPLDVTQALEEGQRAKCIRVSNLHIARHRLDQSHEVLQLRRYVIWGHEINTHREIQNGMWKKAYKKTLIATITPRLAADTSISESIKL